MRTFFRLAVIVGALPVTLANGTTADATQVMSDLNWILNQVNANAAPLSSAALVNANNNFTVVQSGVAATQPANFPIASQVQNSVFTTLSSTLGTNSITARIAALALAAYGTNQVFTFFPSQTNTASVTLAIDGLAPTQVLVNGSPMLGGELQKNSPVSVEYDGTNFNVVDAGPTFSQVQNSVLTTLTSTLGSNQITVRQLSLPLTAYKQGQVFTFQPAVSNSTGGVTLNIDGLGPKAVMAMGTGSIGRELVANLPISVQYDGAQFNLMSRAPGWVLLAQATATNVATVDITTGINSTFDEYEIRISNVTPLSDGQTLLMRLSQDGGATFKAGATAYASTTATSTDGTTLVATGSTGTTQINIISALSFAASAPMRAEIRFGQPSGTTKNKMFSWHASCAPNTNTIATVVGGALYGADQNAFNALRFFMSAGNITMTYALYGLRKT